MKVDLQDVLLVLGVASLCAGAGWIYRPLAPIVFGILCLLFVLLIARTKPNAEERLKANENEMTIKR